MNTKHARRENETLDIAFDIKAEDIHQGGLFRGYASTFGGAPDKGGDVIAKGCFKRTLKEKSGTDVAMLWAHDPRCPIGAWQTIREDEKGLFVEGIVEPTACPDGVPVYKIMKMGGVKGLSIGYNTKDSGEDQVGGKKVRVLKDVDLWEISLVTFPMNTRASVTSVKNIFEAKTERELEDALREAGLSNDKAKYIVGLAKPGLREAARAKALMVDDPILAELKKMNEELTLQNLTEAMRNF